jgi:hypothetical protein
MSRQTETTTTTSQLIKLLDTTIARDGVGFGLTLGLMLIAFILWNLTRKIDPIAIALSINQFIRDTNRLLAEIVTSNRSIAEKISDLRYQMGEMREMQERNRNLNLGMSGDLLELERKVDRVIKEIEKN